MDSPFNLNRLSKIDEASLHFQKLMSKIIDSGKRGYIQKQNFLDDVSKIVDSIFNSDNKSNFEKYKELIYYKNSLESPKEKTAGYQIKWNNEAVSSRLRPSLNNLKSILVAEKKFGVSEKLNKQKLDSDLKNMISQKIIRKIPKTNPEKEVKRENENELIQSESELVRINSGKIENNSNESLLESNLKIKMNLSKEEIYNYFERLCRFKNEINNQPYLSRPDLDQLLSQAFIDYSDKPVPHKLLDLNLTQKQYGIIYTFIHIFYLKNERRCTGVKTKYVSFLKQNFLCFSKMDENTLYSSIRNHSRFTTMELLDFKNNI